MKKFTLIVFVISLSTSRSETTKDRLRKYYNADSALRERLFSGDYDKTVRPSDKGAKNVRVKLDFELRQIIEINMRSEYIYFQATVRQWWSDERLQWSPEEFDNLTVIRAPTDQIWVPDLLILNQVHSKSTYRDTFQKEHTAIVWATGKIYFSRRILMSTTCPFTMAMFPFDLQKCKVIMESWVYTADEMMLVPRISAMNVQQFNEHSEFAMVRTEAIVKVKKVVSGEWVTVFYNMEIKRRPWHFLTMFVFPCMVTELVSLSIFLLPAECGEKMNLSFMLLLQIGVLLLVLAEQLPVNSKEIPLSVIYFGKNIFIVVLTSLFTAIVLNIYHAPARGQQLSPNFCEFVIRHLSRIVCAEENYKVVTGKHGRVERTSALQKNLIKMRKQNGPPKSNQKTWKKPKGGGPPDSRNSLYDTLGTSDMASSDDELTMFSKIGMKTGAKEEYYRNQCIYMSAVMDRFFFWFTLVLDIFITCSFVTFIVVKDFSQTHVERTEHDHYTATNMSAHM